MGGPAECQERCHSGTQGPVVDSLWDFGAFDDLLHVGTPTVAGSVLAVFGFCTVTNFTFPQMSIDMAVLRTATLPVATLINPGWSNPCATASGTRWPFIPSTAAIMDSDARDATISCSVATLFPNNSPCQVVQVVVEIREPAMPLLRHIVVIQLWDVAAAMPHLATRSACRCGPAASSCGLRVQLHDAHW